MSTNDEELLLAPDVGVITMTELAVVDDVEDDESLDEDPGDELSDEVDEPDDEDPLGTDDGTGAPL